MSLKPILSAISLILLSINSCNKKNNQQTFDSSIHKGLLVEVNDSTIIFNKKHTLKMSDSLSQWIKVIGPYNREFTGDGSWDNAYIWDSLGITVNTYHKDNKLYKSRMGLVSQLKVHLQGLNSEVGRAGKLEYAKQYDFTMFKDSLELINYELDNAKNRLKFGRTTKEEVIQKAIEWWANIVENQRPEKYPYPYNSFLGPLYIEGVPIYSDEQLKSLNDRRKANNLDLFSYISYYSGSPLYGKDSTGETEIMYDAYYYVAHPKNEPKTMPMLRYELKVANPRISYIRIEYNQDIANNRLR